MLTPLPFKYAKYECLCKKFVGVAHIKKGHQGLFNVCGSTIQVESQVVVIGTWQKYYRIFVFKMFLKPRFVFTWLDAIRAVD